MSPVLAFLGRHTEQTYALVRIVVPLLYFCHGAQKLFGWFGGMGGHSVWGGPPQFIAAGLIEVPTGILMALGLFTTPIAYGELPVLFSFVFLYIACRGAGIWSLDALRRR
jgi:putative oxidoreductase